MGGTYSRNNGKMRRWTAPEIRSLGGGCALQVAAKLGRSPRAVQDRARSIGVEPPRMPHACYWPKATKARALAMRSEGRSLASISRATGGGARDFAALGLR